MTQKYPNLSRLIVIAAIVIGVGMVFNTITNRQPAAAEVLAVSAGQTDWYQDVMTNGTEWDKSFLPSDPNAQYKAADPMVEALAWALTPAVKFHEGATEGSSEDGSVTVSTAGGDIKVTCKDEASTICENVKDSVQRVLDGMAGSATE